MVLAEPIKDLFENLQVFFVGVGVRQEVIDVDNNVL